MTQTRRPRSALALVAWALLALVLVPAAAAQGGSEERQIHWQRSIEDAVALAAAQKRPLFVAINVDGESGSDRIVNEQYRDPRFVAWTRRFVCLAASVSRHEVRDVDAQGRRVPCPRLGEVTCGEHLALEPLVFDRWLGGERVSPRHALILPDGRKAFDESLLFDLRDLEALVEAAAIAAPPPEGEVRLGRPEGSASQRETAWRKLASARSARGRANLEDVVASLDREDRLLEALDAVAVMGDAGSVGVLRVALAHQKLATPRVIERVGDVAAAVEAGPALARSARARLTTANPFPGSSGLGRDRDLLRFLSRFDGAAPMTRAYLLARAAVGADADRRAAAEALAPLLSTEDVSRVAAAIEAEGGGVQIEDLLVFARDVGTAIPRVDRPMDPPLPDASELDRRLVQADRALTAAPEDVDAQRAFGLASLDVARAAMASGSGNARLNLEDAARWLASAAEARPGDAELGFARARTAYFLGDFAAQERIARATFGGFPPRDRFDERVRAAFAPDAWPDGDVRRAATLLVDDERVEALRWLGDAAARLLPARSGRDPAEEVAGYVRGARALALVAVSPHAGETDWISLATFLSALELEREELAAWQAGVERLPESAALREGLNRSLWLAGRPDLAPVKADWVLARRGDAPSDAWFSGYAWLLWAEAQRRAQAFDAAVSSYETSRARFETYARLAPDRASDVDVYRALTHLGEANAHASAGRRQSAADALVRGVAQSRQVLVARDGLDRDVPDLIDAILEWRAGRKSPVDPRALANELRRVAPDAPNLVVWVSDAELREALRADGRSTRTRTNADGTVERLPDAEGDEYMAAAVDVARAAVEFGPDEGARRNLAQQLTVTAERLLARGEGGAFPRLVEAASILGQEGPATDDLAALRASAAKLRVVLGEARPIFRPGR